METFRSELRNYDNDAATLRLCSGLLLSAYMPFSLASYVKIRLNKKATMCKQNDGTSTIVRNEREHLLEALKTRGMCSSARRR